MQFKTYLQLSLELLSGDATNIEQAMQDQAIQRALALYVRVLLLYRAAYSPLVPLGLLALLTWQTFLFPLFLWALLAALGACLFCIVYAMRLETNLKRLLAPYHLSLIAADVH